MSRCIFLEASKLEASKWDGVSVEAQRGRNHPRLIISVGDRSRKLVHPLTTSDRRAVLNHVATMRRMLAELGATKLK